MDNLMAELHVALTAGEFNLKRLLQYAPPTDWRPDEVGQVVVGVVSRIKEDSRDDYTFPVLELIDQEGLIIRVRCSAMMLRKQILELSIGAGDVISIEFTGEKVAVTSGRTYKTFTVRKL